MEVGNMKVYCQGRFVRGPQYQKAIMSGILVSVPGLLMLFPSSFSLGPLWLHVPCIILTVIGMACSLVFLTLTACVDPGIIPGRELQEAYVRRIREAIDSKKSSKLVRTKIVPAVTIGAPHFSKQARNGRMDSPEVVPFISQQNGVEKSYRGNQYSRSEDVLTDNDELCLNQKSRCYQILTQTHSSDGTALQVHQNGFRFNLKYCSTCRYYRPMRASHSSKSNVCIQRYDHFCYWVGTDVALHNHGYFYLMLFSIISYCGVLLLFSVCSLAMSITIPVACKDDLKYDIASAYYSPKFVCRTIWKRNYIALNKGTVYAALVGSLLVIGSGIYLLYSVVDLLKYHADLLKTGTLTKEDTQGNNLETTGMYSFRTAKENFKVTMYNIKEPRILQQFIKQQEYLVNLAKNNYFVTSFDALSRILKLNKAAGFEKLYPEIRQPVPIRCVRKSMRDSAMGLKENVEDTLIYQKINDDIQFSYIITAKDCFEYAIRRARDTVRVTAGEWEMFKYQHPELLVYGPKRELALVKMCAKKEKKSEMSVEKSKGVPGVGI